MMQELTRQQNLELYSLLSRFSMSDIVSEFELPKQRGVDWLSNCPFCKEKACFIISDSHGIAKCMKCQKSFGKIDFIMTAKNIDMNEIADYLKTML